MMLKSPSYRHGKPTRANRTQYATASDNVMTPKNIAQLIVGRYNPQGLVLEPARGTSTIYDALPNPKDWCEITGGVNFFNYHNKVDWIITNPPFSIYDKFLEHCFELSPNVVLLAPIAKAFKSLRIQNLVDKYGGLKEIFLIGSGSSCGFAFGFPTGCLYYKQYYHGAITYERYNISTPNQKERV